MINFIRRLFGLCEHDWDKWSEPEKSHVNFLFFHLYQRKNCKKCGEVRTRWI